MMAFSNLIFPEIKLKHGIQKEVVDPVTITGNGAREVRRKQNRWERFIWTIPSRQLLDADKVAIHKFLRQVGMGLNSFLYRDPTYPSFVDAPLTNRSGNTWFMNLPYDAITAGTHPVFHPQMGGLVFKKGGVTATATFGGVDSNGFPYVTISGSTPADSITVTGAVYMTVRFEGSLNFSIDAMAKSTVATNSCDVVPTIVTLNDFKLVEVFE